MARPDTCPDTRADSIARNCASRLVSCRIVSLSPYRPSCPSGPQVALALSGRGGAVGAEEVLEAHEGARRADRHEDVAGRERLIARGLRGERAIGMAQPDDEGAAAHVAHALVRSG